MKIKLLRLGHRIHRDHRTTTHCALVARAFGSSEMYYCGNEDDSLQETIEKVNESWGGDFQITYLNSWKSFIKKCKKENHFVILCTIPSYLCVFILLCTILSYLYSILLCTMISYFLYFLT